MKASRAAWWTLLGAVACLLLSPPAQPQPVPRALQVEAAFLVNFLRYTDWPPERAGVDVPWRIAVVGSADAAATVRAVAAAAGQVRGRRIEVEQVALPRNGNVQAARLRASHLVFLHDVGADRRNDILRSVAGAPVLTVGDDHDFALRGGMLGIVRIDARLGIEANPRAIESGGLQVSAKVLKLARIRHGELP